MKTAIIRQYDFNLSFAKKLVDDLSDEQMTMKPYAGFENHPAFTLGHLVTGTAITIEDLGGKSELPDGWSDILLRKGPGDPRLPIEEIEKYPSKKSLINELGNQHEKLKLIFNETNEKMLNRLIKWRFSEYMPTLLDLVTFMCINHEAMHLGQLSAWRRAMKLPSALNML